MEHNQADVLREHGLSVTAQRLEILKVVSRFPHSTAEQVTERVGRKLGAISRQSVYDTLNTLSEKGLLRRIQPTGSSARYEDRINDNHHHVICRSCGVVADVDCAAGRRPCLTASDTHGFVIDEAEVVYWGYCPHCQ
jgi:Fur family ferric uptake transcriptional regulator